MPSLFEMTWEHQSQRIRTFPFQFLSAYLNGTWKYPGGKTRNKIVCYRHKRLFTNEFSDIYFSEQVYAITENMHWLQMIQKTQQKPKQTGCKVGICYSSGFFFLTKPNAAIKGKTFYVKKYEEKITFRVFFVHQYIFIQQFYMLNNIHTYLPYIIV